MNEGILPLPVAAKPILVLLFVQLKTVFGTVPVKFTGAVGKPLQTTWLGIGFTLPDGSTRMLNDVCGPAQICIPAIVIV